jgi:glycosyltransferase involved in cell wall biosynthesis
LASKLRAYVGTENILKSFRPHCILFHGACAYELITVSNYIKHNPEVLLYVDSHEDIYNSARNWLSKEILHKIFYAIVLRYALPYIKKILCYSPESLDFVYNLYRIPKDKLELYPLGGFPIPIEEYHIRRDKTRQDLRIKNDDIVIIQSGKLTKQKKILDSLLTFRDCRNPKLKLLIAGAVDESIKEDFYNQISKDSRIEYLGWKSTNDLTDLLCAADIYLQPGTQSVTMQHSLCCHCAVILDDVPSHKMYVNENGWLIGRDGSLNDIFRNIENADLELMKSRSFEFAKKHLDYSQLAKRIYT